MKRKVGKFIFDFDKFQIVISHGRRFKTDTNMIEMKTRHNFVNFKQSFEYRITLDFINQNYDALYNLDIISPCP